MAYRSRKILTGILLIIIPFAFGFFLFKRSEISVDRDAFNSTSTVLAGAVKSVEDEKISKVTDILPQKPLPNPPAIVKAIYLTSWAGGSERLVSYAIDLAKNTEINSVVLDVKDYSGFVAYDTNLESVERYGAKEIRIPKINSLIKRFHDAGIYVIARITVFQDPVLAKARPDLAVQSILKASSTGNIKESVWFDRKGLAWIDPASREAWNYIVAIGKDVSERGFDELNFDYIRFPSDGNLKDAKFPFWDEISPQHKTIRSFFKYLREGLPGIKISADLFGLSTVAANDLGIGQMIEDAYEYFDAVSPMVYPSHYAKGTIGYENPANYPYEIVKYSMDGALTKLLNPPSTSTIFIANLRPWLQDFDLGADYDVAKVQAQIQAAKDALGEKFGGFMLWNPSNVYTRGALEAE